MLSVDEIAAAVTVLGSVAAALIKSHKDTNKRLARFESDSRARETACVERLQQVEDQRRTDAITVIDRNTSAMVDNASSNRELSGALNRLVVAVATMPGQDGEAALKRINREAADLTPRGHHIQGTSS